MNEPTDIDKHDKYLESVKEAKKVKSVVKTEFANFVSAVPEDARIFAYEGPDDKVVYYHWIRRLRDGLKYVPYVCKNKTKVLQLLDSLRDDRTNLIDKVYFFIDHDFDGLQGSEDHARLFVTDKYSVENYVVDACVLDDILVFDFHCLNEQERNAAKEIFERLYTKFLLLTKDLNFRIFVARKCKIHQIGETSSKLNLIARVEFEDVYSIIEDLKSLVVLSREPTLAEYDSLKIEFDHLEPRSKYRGKFALQFFSKWLGHLRRERMAQGSAVFSQSPVPEFSIKGDFSLDAIASKSRHPEGLQDFLRKIA